MECPPRKMAKPVMAGVYAIAPSPPNSSDVDEDSNTSVSYNPTIPSPHSIDHTDLYSSELEEPDCRFAETLRRWAKLSSDAKEQFLKAEQDANLAAIQEFTHASIRHDRMTRTNRSVIVHSRRRETFIPGKEGIQYVPVPFMCTPEIFAQYSSNYEFLAQMSPQVAMSPMSPMQRSPACYGNPFMLNPSGGFNLNAWLASQLQLHQHRM